MKLLTYQDLNSKYQLGLSKEYFVKSLNEDEKLKYIDNYINYINLKYGVRKMKKKAEKIKPILTQFENKLKYEVIQNMREAARFKMSHNKGIDDIDEQIKQLKGKGIKGFFSN